MKKSTTAWMLIIGGTALEFAFFVAWKGYGIEPAGNVLLFWLWFLSIVGTLLLFFSKGLKPSKSAAPRSTCRIAIEAVSTIAMIAILAWFGHFVIAAMYASGQLGFIAYREKFDAHGNPIEEKS